ncbi:MAG TPA: N-acetylmuramoyl-L-alanine amidase [Phycisphaerae bacterium]|nr:N-acetylmuramoyl-L-alanine amidase [Phycisphaerae bacterium]
MRRTTRTLHGSAVLAALLAVATAGCQPKGVAGLRGDEQPAPPGRIALDDLARQLGMTVVHTSFTSATLRDTANTVVLYSDPEGEAYVNGRALPDSGGTVAQERTLLVPTTLLWRIRSVLRPAEREPTERPDPTPPRPLTLKPGGRVVIDPGHGGRQPGAVSVLGGLEKHLVLIIAKRVAKELRKEGVEVLLTRSRDVFVELEDRPAVANRSKADLFVSIHADAWKKPSTRGFTAYVSKSASARSVAAANAIVRRMQTTGTRSKGVRRKDLIVLVHSKRPAVLVEVGYLTNRWEAARLNTDGYRSQVARAIALGVLDYLQRR